MHFPSSDPAPIHLQYLVVLVSLGQVLLQERQVLLDTLTAFLAHGRSGGIGRLGRLAKDGFLRVESGQLGSEVRREGRGGRGGGGGVGADGGGSTFFGLWD